MPCVYVRAQVQTPRPIRPGQRKKNNKRQDLSFLSYESAGRWNKKKTQRGQKVIIFDDNRTNITYTKIKKTFFFCFWRWARSSVTKRKQTTSSFFFFFCLPLISLRFIDHDSDTSKQHGRLGGAGVESPRTIGIIGHFTFLTKQMTCSNGEMAWDSVFRTFFLLFRKATAAVFTQRKKIKPVPAWVSFWYLYCKERERHCASVYLRRACPVYRLSPVWGLLPLLRVFILDLDIYIFLISFFLSFFPPQVASFFLSCVFGT